MRKRELKKIFAGFLVASTVLAGCGAGGENAEKPEEKKQEQPAQKEQKEVKVEDTDSAKQTAAFEEMKAELEKAEENNKVDWNLVQKKYQDGLQKDVAEISADFDQAIQASIEAGKSGEMDAVVAGELINKTTQSYFYQSQKTLQKAASEALGSGKKKDAEMAFAQVKHLAEKVFIPTAEKRDNYYELTGENSVAENINSGLSAQEEALKADKAEDFSVYMQVTDKSIYRTFYLATKSYGEKIEAAVKEGKDKAELSIMQAEGWGFLQAIKESLGGGDEAAAAELNKLFTLNETDPSAIKGDNVNKLFNKAIIGKINGYYTQAPEALKAGEQAMAKVEAMEGNMFLKALQMQMNEKLGEDKSEETLNEAEKFYTAVSDNKQDEAKAHAKTVMGNISELAK
ncbi:hypothetical protein [Mesobacillus zeae]|uniref:Lipoprotein n=1 Tax=Mesobacillus zeae TaxID=1917180 RepID=A0A398B623_9BACI|nr:hypothetical protein [Mesobacillus zeae]RID83206.1 hypothetical protein D1970_16965 [Mesobacillus zeae]